MVDNKKGLGDYYSFAEKKMAEMPQTQQISSKTLQSVSDVRRATLTEEAAQGRFRDGSGNGNISDKYSETALGRILTSSGGGVAGIIPGTDAGYITKTAQSFGGGPIGRSGHGDSVMQAPEVYSPLWLISNLSLPRDRATINAWCRSFFALNPYVHNAISLHSTYPISKLSIKCPNKDIEKFFNDMIEEIDLMNVCIQIAQEYWLLGEAFVYAELDESKGKWSRLHIQNPDFMIVKRTVVASEPIIMLRPDENLKKIIMSNRPTDIEQRRQLNQHIIDSVRRGDNIPLDNFNVSHIARRISPYEIHGTGLPVCVFRALMLMDRLKECYSEDTEVLTDRGFKFLSEITHISSNIQLNPNYVNGVALDDNGDVGGILTLKDNIKIACFNQETSSIEYHIPNELHMSKYTGKMIHFTGKNVNTLVTPNHKMLAVKRYGNNYDFNDFKLIKASEFEQKGLYKFRACANWEGEIIEEVDVLGNKVPIDTYLKYIGNVLAEGCVDTSLNKKTGQWRNRTIVSQAITSRYYDDMRNTVNDFAFYINKHASHSISKRKDESPLWEGNISSKELNKYLYDQIGINNECDSYNKKIPRWVLQLDKKYLQILLSAMVDGDGSRGKLVDNDKISYRYFTVCEQLANDVQEAAFKCGYSSFISKDKRPDKNRYEYTVRWSDSEVGTYPTICNSEKTVAAKIKEVDYDGVVWCFEVPTGAFITRRDRRISIHGNSKFTQADGMINPTTVVKIGSDIYKPSYADLEAYRAMFEAAENNKNFKIFTQNDVDIQRIGFGQGILDIQNDLNQLIKEIFIGLQVPQVMMDGGADTTYANGGVALDLLRQRYMSFRYMMSAWLKTKIFAPISKIQGFYDYSGGNKQLIVPEIDWNHMSLFDASDYIQTLVTLTTGEPSQRRASVHTLYRSLGLEYEDEIRQLRKESIQDTIAKKEKIALESMELNSLRALDDDAEIPEPIKPDANQPPAAQEPLPGETPGGALPDLGSLTGGGPIPSLPNTPAPPSGNEAPAPTQPPAPTT